MRTIKSQIFKFGLADNGNINIEFSDDFGDKFNRIPVKITTKDCFDEDGVFDRGVVSENDADRVIGYIDGGFGFEMVNDYLYGTVVYKSENDIEGEFMNYEISLEKYDPDNKDENGALLIGKDGYYVNAIWVK